MGREHIEFVDTGDIAWQPSLLPGFAAQARTKTLSEDDETGAATLMLDFPAGWQRNAGRHTAPVEVFVLRGDLTIVGERLTDGCYTYVPAGMSYGPLESRNGCLALVMFEGEPDFVEGAESDPEADPEQYVPCVNTAEMDWSQPNLDGPPLGILIKMLRIDPETADWTWVAAVLPFWRENRAEVHSTVEEAFMLRGECLLGERGIMREGSYFWRPPNVPHGPLVSKSGGMWFFRTKGGSLDVTYTEPPGWERRVREYMDSGPLFAVSADGG